MILKPSAFSSLTTTRRAVAHCELGAAAPGNRTIDDVGARYVAREVVHNVIALSSAPDGFGIPKDPEGCGATERERDALPVRPVLDKSVQFVVKGD